MSQTKIKTRIEKRQDGKYRQVADIKVTDWPYLFRYDPRSPTGLVYLPRQVEVFRASRNPEEHCEAWNREYAMKPVEVSPVLVWGRAYPVRVIHEALGTLALMPRQVPLRGAREPRERIARKPFEDDVLQAIFGWVDGVLVWRPRDMRTWEMLGYAGKSEEEVAEWNRRWGGSAVAGLGKGYVRVEHVGGSKRGPGLARSASRVLIRGAKFVEQMRNGSDPRDAPGLTRREREAINRAMQTARADPTAAAEALERFEDAIELRERGACVRLEHIAAALAAPLETLQAAKRGYVRRGVTKDERIAMFVEAFPILWRWDYVERSDLQTGKQRLRTDIYWLQAPKFVPIDEEGWLELRRIGLVDAVPTPARQKQWNTTRAGQSFTEGKTAVGSFRITFDELMMVAPLGVGSDLRVDERLWEEAAPGPEPWQTWMRVRPMGF